MPNPTSTNVDLGHVVIKEDEYDYSGLLTFGGAGTVLAGAILARDSVSLKYVPFVVGGSTNQNGIPKAILTETVVATGAGDLPVRPLLKGVVNRARLIIHADGTNANLTKAIEDSLRLYEITPSNVTQIAG